MIEHGNHWRGCIGRIGGIISIEIECAGIDLSQEVLSLQEELVHR